MTLHDHECLVWLLHEEREAEIRRIALEHGLRGTIVSGGQVRHGDVPRRSLRGWIRAIGPALRPRRRRGNRLGPVPHEAAPSSDPATADGPCFAPQPRARPRTW